jgi:2'-5' RNA ligase
MAMHGVVSLLDDEHYALVEHLWDELETKLGVRSICKTPFPHFSYHVAEGYAVGLLEPILRRLASHCGVFRVRTGGLGVFSGDYPVLYVAVVRSPALSALNQKLWQELAGASTGAVEYYHPEQWMPHITLADGDVLKDHLPEAVRLLSARAFDWEIEVTNLSLIYDTGTAQEVRLRFDLLSGSETIRGVQAKA